MFTVCVGASEGEIEKSTPKKSYTLDYLSDGFHIGLDDERRVETISINVRPSEDEWNSRAFSGRIRYRDNFIELPVIETVGGIVSTFGQPDEDEERPRNGIDYTGFEEFRPPYSRHLIYFRVDSSWMVFVDESAKTRSIFVCRPLPRSPHHKGQS
jgi:hypothetical protein